MMRPCIRCKRTMTVLEMCERCMKELMAKRRQWIRKARRHLNAEQSEE